MCLRAQRLTKEKVIRIWTESSNLEYLYHVEKLSMDVPNYCYRRCYMYDIAFFHQELFGFGAYCFYDGIGEQLLLVESCYALVQIDARCSEKSAGSSKIVGHPFLTGKTRHSLSVAWLLRVSYMSGERFL